MNDVKYKSKQSGMSALSGFFGDKDTTLILALIMLLYSDNCDKLLIMALVYILT